MAKKPFINKYGFVEYPFLHDKRKEKNWWLYNLMEDYLKRRAKHKAGPTYTRDDCEEDFKKIELHAHTLKGMIANFFAEDLRVAAYDIEKMGHNSEISGYESQLAVLDEKLPMLITELRSFCG